MKRPVLPALIVLIAVLFACFDAARAAETAKIGRTIDDSTAMRASPAEDSDVLLRLPADTPVDILRSSAGDGTWVYVTANGVRGYVRSRSIDTELSTFAFVYPRTVSAPGGEPVPVYRNPNGTGEIGVLAQGSEYEVIKMYASAAFHRIRFDKKLGYVCWKDVDVLVDRNAQALSSLSVLGADLTRSFIPERKGYVARVTDPDGRVTLRIAAPEGMEAAIDGGERLYPAEYTFLVPEGFARKIPILINGTQTYEVLFCRDVLSVANWNIKRGNGRIVSQSALIAAHDPDILSLQEVYINESGSTRVNNLKALRTGRLTDSLFTKTKTFDENIGQYGIGVLSAYPILSCESYVLPSSELGLEQRALQKIVFSWNGHRISLYNCHLSYERTTARRKQYARVMEIVNADTCAYKILTGDFNEQWPLFNDLEGWTVTNGRGLEFFGYDGLPFKRTTVDNILVTDNFTVVDVSMEDVLLSDHKPLFVMLTIE